MKNLAGNVNADKYIRRELERAQIPIEVVELTASEVPYTLAGRLGEFEFRRAWYYWVVKGLVPLVVAQKLHQDPVGKTDIRVNGHCGCPAPEEQAIWFTPDGKVVRPLADEADYQAFLSATNSKPTGEYLFSDTPETLGAKQFITSYHIDSEVGLRLFVDTLKSHELVPA